MPVYREKVLQATGCEAYYVVPMDAIALKRLTAELEDSSFWPYFARCVRTGTETAGQPAPETFSSLGPIGREAEAKMLTATHGGNTNKGAIFSLGLVCAALGRLDGKEACSPKQILAECAAMARGLCSASFEKLTPQAAKTVGQRLYLAFGITGVRGQAEAGFPAVLNIGLPILEQGLSLGYDLNRSGCAALLHILAHTTDTGFAGKGKKALASSIERSENTNLPFA